MYTSTNAVTGNSVEEFARQPDGALAHVASFPAGGTGTGGSGFSQGPVTLSADGTTLLAVDAGSDQVSEFAVSPDGRLRRTDVVPSGGINPVSVAIRGGLVEVLNAGGAANVTGFRASGSGLVPVAGGSQPLSKGASSPEDVTMSPDSGHVVVTEKVSDTIDTFAVAMADRSARRSPARRTALWPSRRCSPPGGRLLVADDGAAGTSAVSSYLVRTDGTLVASQAPVSDSQTAACWITLGPGGDVFVANAGSGTIAAYRVLSNGTLAFVRNTSAGTGAKPLDIAVSSDGRDLYVLDGTNQIASFSIGAGAPIKPAGRLQPLPAGSAGIAAS